MCVSICVVCVFEHLLNDCKPGTYSIHCGICVHDLSSSLVFSGFFEQVGLRLSSVSEAEFGFSDNKTQKQKTTKQKTRVELWLDQPWGSVLPCLFLFPVCGRK